MNVSKEKLDSLMNDWREGGIPDDYQEHLHGVYDESVADVVAPYSGKIDTLTNQVNEYSATLEANAKEISRLKSEMYDQMQFPSDNDNKTPEPDEPQGVSSLFQDRKA